MTRLFGLSCAAYVVVWVWAATVLPDRVPVHFGAGGGADSWGSRTEALAIFAVAGAGIALVMGLCLLAVRQRRWAWINVPHKEWWIATPERQERMRRMALTDLGAIAVATMVLLIVLLAGTVEAAGQPDPALPWWFFLVLGSFLVGVLAWTVWSVSGRYRPDDGGLG